MATAVARRYAAAFFAVAQADKAIDRRGDDLARAVETLSNQEVVAALRNPRLDVADRVRLALELIDGVGDNTKNLVRLLVEHGRIAVLPDVLSQYRVLADRASGVVRAQVTTAVAISAAARKRIADALRERFGAEVQVEHREDPRIIAGLVLRVGDRVIDNSIRTHLQQLQASLQ
jgi:F-type H+-transporting ATPase subunit delta